MPKQFKITLAAARVNAGFTQADMARMMQKSKGTINAWENGRTAIDSANFMLFCNLCGIDPDFISLSNN